MESQPIIIEQTMHAPVATVWQAITDTAQMKQWYFDIAEFKPEVGFAFSFEAGPKGKKYLHLCEVIEVIPGKKLTYSWHYQCCAGMSYVTFALTAEGEQTRVTLTHEGFAFETADPNFSRESCVQGWTQIIGTSLKNFVET